MKTKKLIKRARYFAGPFRITKGKDFRLKDIDPNDTLEFTKEADKPKAKDASQGPPSGAHSSHAP